VINKSLPTWQTLTFSNFCIFKNLKAFIEKKQSFETDLIKGYKINFSLQVCMYLFTIIHSMLFTKPQKVRRKKESTLTQIAKIGKKR